MRLKLLLGIVTAAALSFAGVAVAHHVGASTQAVSATFAATDVSRIAKRTCTGSDGTYEVTRALYTGSATSETPSLNGKIELRVESTFNKDENLGVLAAGVRILDEHGHALAHGRLHAVNAAGKVQGLLEGSVRDPRGKLLGVLSATYSADGGFTEGALGSGSTTAAALVYNRGCAPKAHPRHPAKHEAKERRADVKVAVHVKVGKGKAPRHHHGRR